VSRTAEQLLDAAAERLAALERARREIATISELGESDGGEVQAVVDGAGALLDLRLAPGTVRMPPDALAALIVQAAARAAERATRRMHTIRALAEGDAIAHEWDRQQDPDFARPPLCPPDARPPAPPRRIQTSAYESSWGDAFSFDPASLRSNR